MSESYAPQPRYSKEHKDLATESKMPLFTFDLYCYPLKRRTTVTGVLNQEDGEAVIGMIRRALENKVPNAS